MSFECRFNKPGIYEMSAGCVIEKLNTTADWDLAKCLRLEKDDKYCLRANSFSEIINEGWA